MNSTKLYVPTSRLEQVHRQRLFQLLDAGLCGRLTLVSAPAGFGKTTLVSEWVRASGRPVAWLSLDEQDNDLQRFLTYLIHALRTVWPGFGESVLNSLCASQLKGQSPEQSGFWEALESEFAEIRAPLILVLDDFHLLSAPVVQEIPYFLLTHTPAALHLVLVTRSDPPWQLGRLRARREIHEVRAADLRFTLEESRTFLNEEMGLGLSEAEIALLDGRAEGWIAGLQLAGLSMRGQTDHRRFIEDLAGSHRYIFDYLVEEVLEKQPPEIQSFLLQTSVLKEMNALLCDSLTGRSDSRAVLLYLERANLFLQPLDDERCWYRYHHLFADLLRLKAGQSAPVQVAALHRRASLWFEQSQMVADAIHHALAGGDFERVVGLVKGRAFSMLDTGELGTLLAWLDGLPREWLRIDPWMSVFYAWALAYTGQLDPAQEYLSLAEDAAEAGPGPGPDPLRGQIAAIRVLIAKNRGEMSRAVDFARQALAWLPEQDVRTRCYVAQTQGNALLFTGDLEAASQAFQMAVTASQQGQGQNIHRAAYALCDLSGLQWMRGQLREAEASCREALRLAEQGRKDGGRLSPGAGYAYARCARILLEWNDLAAAFAYVEQGVTLSQRRGQADILFFCLVTLAEVQISARNVPAALLTFQKIRLLTSRGASWHAALIDQFENEARLSHGDVAAAAHWLQRMGWKPGDPIPADQANAFEFVARILVAQGQYLAAVNLAEHLIAQEQAKGALAYVLLLRLTLACAWQALGQPERALGVLSEALAQAEPEGYLRTFVDRGPGMYDLLQKAAGRGMFPGYVHRLLTAFEASASTPILAPRAPQPGELFSERELEVLCLLGTDLDAPEIAEKLVISTHTVRSHIKSIYRKLNAHSRHEAVQQAKSLDLIY